jgi:chromosomal replication initiation ATPase DnaA
MNISDSEIQTKLAGWQNELRQMTGNDSLVIIAHEEPKTKRSIDEIIIAVCAETGISIGDIRKQTRKRDIVVARHLVAYYGRNCACMGFKDLGEIIGGRDHTTAIHACMSIKNMLDTHDLDVCTKVARINLRLELNSGGGQA